MDLVKANETGATAVLLASMRRGPVDYRVIYLTPEHRARQD